MKRHFYTIRQLILPVIDFFYPPFRKLMSVQTFRYAVSGATNTVFGLFVFYISYHYIFRYRTVDLQFYALEPYTAALCLSFIAAFFFGFFLMKYVVFDDSTTRGRVQLFRYMLVCLFNLFLNYVLLKLAVEVLNIYPTFAQLGTTVVVIVISYLAQRHFTFKKNKVPDYVHDKDINEQ